MKVGKFPEQLSISAYQAKEPLVFGTAAKLGTWAEEQKDAWASITRPTVNAWTNGYSQQINHFNAIAAACIRYRQNTDSSSSDGDVLKHWNNLRNELSDPLNGITSGRTLTTDAPLFSQISNASKVDPNAAALLYFIQRSDAIEQIQNAQQYGAHFNLALIRLASSNDSAAVDPSTHASEIRSLKSQLRQDSETFHTQIEGWSSRYEQLSTEATQDNASRSTAWQEELVGVRGDWDRLKKTYDEQLALQAPTQYWKDREANSRRYAIAFGISFLAVSVTCLVIFVVLGIPYLHEVAAMKDTNVLVLALPVLIPGFMAIWLLRILGRLFAENLQLSIDAGERQTMVKTFLALMHDEERGKALVTDNDRILILHALFRPSAVSSADDAPPVHWFDILSQKLGGPKK